jgi:hypothetical protein
MIWVAIGFVCLCLLQTSLSAVVSSMFLSKGLSILLQVGVDACWFSVRFACQSQWGTWEQYRYSPQTGSMLVNVDNQLETPFLHKSVDLPLHTVVRASSLTHIRDRP